MKNDLAVKRALEEIKKIYGNTTVPQSQTREDLEKVRDDIDERLALLLET